MSYLRTIDSGVPCKTDFVEQVFQASPVDSGTVGVLSRIGEIEQFALTLGQLPVEKRAAEFANEVSGWTKEDWELYMKFQSLKFENQLIQ